jgi:membrane protease YdiL (CAAX protease family)
MMSDSKLNRAQTKKGLALTACFVVLRLIVTKLWAVWFGGNYVLSVPFLIFLSSVFLVMSVGLVYLGFTRWVGVDITPWWFKRGRILGDILWGVGVMICLGALLLGVGIVLFVLHITPPNLASQSFTSLAQLPVNLALGSVFGFAIASFTEETLFRGFLQDVIGKKYGKWAGNLLQAALFSAAHLGMEPLGSIGNAAFLLLFRFGFGVLMGCLKMKRGTLLAAGIVHGFIG